MKLQTKFFLGIAAIFGVLAVVVALISLNYVNTNTIREAERRVQIYARAAWEIHNGRQANVLSALEVLANKPSVVALLREPGDEATQAALRQELEAIRQEQGMDILNLLAPDGTVLLRTRFPYNAGDNVAHDPIVQPAMQARENTTGDAIFEPERLDAEGTGLVERCLAVTQEPRGMVSGAAVPVIEGGQLLGIVEMGVLLNGSVEEVDRIRDAVFANEYYDNKPVGTATIFMGDTRISTNVLDNQGRRALGTRVSQAVAEHVLDQGLSWTGRAFVVDTWYLSQYDPIRDPAGQVIGMLYVGELEQKYLDLRTQALILYLSTIVGGMCLAMVMAFFITRGILGPIRRLSEATTRISEGDLDHRVTARGGDEVAGLAGAFNDMAGQLARQRQEIESNQQALEDLNRALRSTNRNYMEMLGFVTHELKNPLASAILGVHTVKDGYLGEITAAQKKSLDSAAISLDYFQDMIRNYLDLSRLEKGEMVVHPDAVPLGARVVIPAVEGLIGEIEARRMVVENRIPERLVVQADPNLLRIVYNNLLSNAVKYGREGGRIVLGAEEEAGRLVLSVRNDSQGIPPEKLPQLFQKFGRLDTAEFEGKRGSGLGLYICKEIVEKHGGEIWADSRLGQWVQFSFTLSPPGA